ncbi:nicotinamide-nucleotide adenylyltransferase, NadR type [Chitinophaga rupis]|uniref:Nicotinamide-nucleotide adenylyltransferase, NadR type n=1 Tax=Chitinophaga rupis TaxID=573321 RepID=A0A1H7JZD1_9BACT|nr:ATP-binding protein [Chitinophaga rupis]SEK79919.1 nicotinamide-nucleotide adenylyltransferase, NadR type [Chitinophaga rupis]
MHKIVVLGPESTGKSTLSQKLAAHYNTVWTPEYAREYIENLPRSYEQHDLLAIARGQLQLEDEKAQQASELLICDTDLYVIKVWSEHKYGQCDPQILEQIASRRYDLYLLTYIDIPWENDPQREYPDPQMREYFYRIYRDIVMNSGVPWADIRGSYAEREAKAIAAVDALRNVKS